MSKRSTTDAVISKRTPKRLKKQQQNTYIFPTEIFSLILQYVVNTIECIPITELVLTCKLFNSILKSNHFWRAAILSTPERKVIPVEEKDWAYTNFKRRVYWNFSEMIPAFVQAHWLQAARGSKKDSNVLVNLTASQIFLVQILLDDLYCENVKIGRVDKNAFHIQPMHTALSIFIPNSAYGGGGYQSWAVSPSDLLRFLKVRNRDVMFMLNEKKSKAANLNYRLARSARHQLEKLPYKLSSGKNWYDDESWTIEDTTNNDVLHCSSTMTLKEFREFVNILMPKPYRYYKIGLHYSSEDGKLRFICGEKNLCTFSMHKGNGDALQSTRLQVASSRFYDVTEWSENKPLLKYLTKNAPDTTVCLQLRKTQLAVVINAGSLAKFYFSLPYYCFEKVQHQYH